MGSNWSGSIEILFLTNSFTTTYLERMKVLISSLIFFILALAFQVQADECKDAKLIIRDAKTLPKPSLKRMPYKDSKLWFTQESHQQESGKVNYDTVIIAVNSTGSLVEILAQGHFREHAVNTKWVNEHTLNVLVEWGHIQFCSYDVDVEKRTASLLQQKKSDK